MNVGPAGWTVQLDSTKSFSSDTNLYLLRLFYAQEAGDLARSGIFTINNFTAPSSSTGSTISTQTSSAATLPTSSAATAPGGLAIGAKAGIGIGVSAAVLLGVLLGWFLLGRRRSSLPVYRRSFSGFWFFRGRDEGIPCDEDRTWYKMEEDHGMAKRNDTEYVSAIN